MSTRKELLFSFSLATVIAVWLAGWSGILFVGLAVAAVIVSIALFDLVRYALAAHSWKRRAPEERWRTAIHEAGHAVFAWHNSFVKKVIVASVLSRDGSTAYVISQWLRRDSELLRDDKVLRQFIASRISCCLAGIIAESIFLEKDINAYRGAENDTLKATTLALNYAGIEVTRRAVDELFSTQDAYLAYPSCIQDKNLLEAHKILHEASIGAGVLLEVLKEKVFAVAESLLENKLLMTEDLEKILGPKVVSDNPEFIVVIGK